MKIISTICLAFILFAPSVYGADKMLNLSAKTLSPTEVNQIKNENLGKSTANNYATIITIENIPDIENFKIKIERPLLKEIPSEKNKKFHDQIDIKREAMVKMGKDFGTDFPCFMIQSNGFLPGEEVSLIVECKNYKSAPLKFSPHPLQMKSAIDKATVSIRLAGLGMSTYAINFKDFNPNEKIKYTSESCGELISKTFEAKSNVTMLLTCGVIGYEGGLDTFKIIRNNGEALEITFPWGTDLVEHLYGGQKGMEAKTQN